MVLVECKSDSEKDKSISIKNYLDRIKEHLIRMINDKRKSGEWKIQLVVKINFVSSKNFDDYGICIVNLIILKL